ncbi:pilus assembly protein TadG-related protein, partial [Zhongshania sp.]|uniref:pilus assembly protein TadG-related protein n=1 Tax=Zhongshania sp. TaxID=1971902 RepID=UPI003567BD3C
MNTLQLGKVPSKRQQRGVMTILAALTLTTLIAFLALVVDTGRLYLEKRTLQKNADLAAIETALLYCRDQELDEAGRRAIALDALSASRNNFLGEEGDIIVKLGLVGAAIDENGANSKSFTEDNSGKAIQVTLSRTVPASLFESFSFGGNDTVTLSRTAVAQACQPEALVSLDSSILSIDSSQSALLNSVLGGFLGSAVSVSVGEWNGLLTSNINLLSFLDALAIDLGVTAGSYDEVLGTSISLADLLDVAADVLTSDGNIIAASGLQALVLAIPVATPPIQLGELISVQTGAPDAAFDIAISALDLTQASIQLANTKNALVADIPAGLLGV